MLTKAHLEQYEKILWEKFKPMTVRDKLTILKVFLNFCFREGHTKYNPHYYKIPKVMARRVVTQKDEYEKMCVQLNPFKYHELQMLLIMRFLAMGLRCGEVAKLNISDFNNISPKVMYTIIRSEKSKRERVISWKKETHELLVRYLGTRICLNKDDYLFGRSGKRITTRTIQRWFHFLKERAGIEKPITPHSVRHMAAHLAWENGADLKTIQLKLGHSHISSTDHYLNLDPRESVKALNKYRLV